MNNNILDSNSIVGQECTGCGMCSAVCPTNAIDIKLTKYGFYEPIVNNELCIECGYCKKNCYKFDNNIKVDKKNDYKSFSAINKDEYELKTSTSGGVSIELMKECIKQGYKVVGVAYDYENEIAVTKIASSKEELQQFKGSKYFQSYTEVALQLIMSDKTDQKYAIFGTPCQIYSIAKYSEYINKKDKFILIDLFCHGCPSINLWKKYLEDNKDKHKVEKFNKIEFRSKVHGWHEYAFKFFTDSKVYNSNKINDPFYELFFGMNIHNKACYSCKCRSTMEYCDLRMGDFWGTNYDKDTKGVSAVVVGSNKGKKLIYDISSRFTIKEEKFDDIIKWQSYGTSYKYNEKIRKAILNQLRSDKTIKDIVKNQRKTYSSKKKMANFIKSIIKKMPNRVSINIRKFIHSFSE